jgi:16S rRNA (uracil1498-N3)-methyltransferase
VTVQRPPRDQPVFFVADVDRPALTDADRHHATRVLRVRPGAPITVADGGGQWRSALLGDLLALPDDEIHVEPAPAHPTTVGFSLLKGDRNELVVQKLTELGIDEIVLLLAERSVVRWEAGAVARKLERLEIVAREACTQSRRARLPRIVGPVRVEECATRDGGAGRAGGRVDGAGAGGGPRDREAGRARAARGDGGDRAGSGAEGAVTASRPCHRSS